MMISDFGRTYMHIGAGTVGICMSNATIYRSMMVFWSSTSRKLNNVCANLVDKFSGIEDCDGCGSHHFVVRYLDAPILSIQSYMCFLRHVDLGTRARVTVLRDAKLYMDDQMRVAIMVGCFPYGGLKMCTNR
ncbi:hypothetical protein GOP47_0001185 [Adiantum capillus-veneris]|uniref:Uncharacterized protein n=1 Tax=Adiantum capillus-veneris TaxID=13818 RepID=A0A9D4ZSZ3_ADICA|nr:hypothetical protein GOP47_0001185 [Adiantum capillus-veneris]